MSHKCSVCGAAAFYDGRMGDGPVLVCGCDQGPWVNDGRGGYVSNPRNAQPVENTADNSKRRGDDR